MTPAREFPSPMSYRRKNPTRLARSPRARAQRRARPGDEFGLEEFRALLGVDPSGRCSSPDPSLPSWRSRLGAA